jgi:hypothetical protein
VRESQTNYKSYDGENRPREIVKQEAINRNRQERKKENSKSTETQEREKDKRKQATDKTNLGRAGKK